MAKKRNRNQRYSELSSNKLQIALNEWVLNPLHLDYGFDFEARICGPDDGLNQTIEESSIYIQLKETTKQRKYWDLPTDDLSLFYAQSIPAVIFLYIEPQDCFYWIIAQSYVPDELAKSDPQWRSKDKKRIYFSKRLDSIDELKNEILAVQKRIYRDKIFGLDIGEGISPDNRKQHYERSLKEAKNAAFQGAIEDILTGKHDTAMTTFEEILQMPKDDEYKANAIINAIFQLNSANPNNFDKIINLAEHGIVLAESLGALSYKYLLTIARNQVYINIIYTKISRLLLHKNILSYQADEAESAFFSIFYDDELREIMAYRQDVTNEINENLALLVNGRHAEEFDIALTILLEIVTFQVRRIAPLNLELLTVEEYRRPLISTCEDRLEYIRDPHLRQMMHHRLSEYYYYIRKYDLAVSHIKLAIQYADEVGYQAAVTDYKNYLKDIEKKPDPYTFDKEVVPKLISSQSCIGPHEFS